MYPTQGLIIAAGWLSSPMLVWTMAILGCIALLGGCVYLVRYRRAETLALVRHPFAKYVIFSVLAHVVLAVWFLTFRDDTPVPPGRAVIVVEMGETMEPAVQEPPKPWENPPSERIDGTVPALEEQTPPTIAEERPWSASSDDQREDALQANTDTLVQDISEQPDTLPDAFEPQVAPDKPSPAWDESMAFDAAPTFDDAPPVTPAPEPVVATQVVSQQLPTLNESPSEAVNREAAPATLDNPVASAPDVTEMVSSPWDPQLSDPPESSMQDLPTDRQARLQPNIQAVSVPREDRLPAQRKLPSRTKVKRRPDGRPVPVIYRDRWAEDRLTLARTRGGSEDTEAAVRAALVWLAQAQGTDGRWDASQFGSGRRVLEGGHDRGPAGMHADTATTGLAVLAFLGAGHTHTEGEYADTVRRGIDFLIRSQRTRSDGSIVGQATGYAAMYCHGIATLCMSEAHSLTGDASLRQSVRDAIGFTLAAQHRDGGWRYQPQQPGDTSQLGWQLMALTSAHYGGFARAISTYPTRPWTRASRFLDTVSWGNAGGLASYRPQMRPTRAMTAEALLCRLLLNTPTDHPRIQEAAAHLMSELPGQGRLNYYYWYYGTLGLYHLQDHHWQRWNESLTEQLLARQKNDGSWPTENSVWGNAGGTVYTTALAAMTLEVYYRYRPFAETHQVDRTARRQ